MAANRGKTQPPGSASGEGTITEAAASYIMYILLTGKPSQVTTDFGTIATAADGTTSAKFITWDKR